MLDVATLDNASLDELIKIQEQIRARKAAIKEAEKAQKEPVFKALLKCPGCDCGGYMGNPDGNLYCGKLVKANAKPAKMEPVKTWQVGGRGKIKSEEVETNSGLDLGDAGLEKPPGLDDELNPEEMTA